MSGMFQRRTDLALARDPSVRILPWIVALMVYLATLTLAVLLVLSTLSGNWSRGLSSALTIHVAALEGEEADALEARVEAARRVALKTPGVRAADPIPVDRVAAMLEPWIGERALLDELPLPRLIDVRLDGETEVDLEALRDRLQSTVPESEIDDHARWRDRVIAFTRWMEAIAALMVGLIALASAAVVVFATRSGLAVHRDAIEVLHLIGARDAYIAAQFESHAARLGLLGGGLGVVVAAATLGGLAWLAADLGIEAIPPFLLTSWQWLSLLSLPLAASLIARITARRTVLRTLAAMP